MVVDVLLTVRQPLEVRRMSGSAPNATVQDSATNGATLTLPAFIGDDSFPTQYLRVVRNIAWSITGVDTNKISVSPTSGPGVTTSPYVSASAIVVNKASSWSENASTTTAFQVVSDLQSVTVAVSIQAKSPAPTFEFIDAPPNGGALAAQETIYIYT